MKISVYRKEDGGYDVLVQASPGKGLSPVMLQGLTRDDISEKTRRVVDEMRLAKRPPPANT